MFAPVQAEMPVGWGMVHSPNNGRACSHALIAKSRENWLLPFVKQCICHCLASPIMPCLAPKNKKKKKTQSLIVCSNLYN